ncbi:MAG TPA: hypothetical protein VF707_15935 [Ardenticatenaceae bacterium]
MSLVILGGMGITQPYSPETHMPRTQHPKRTPDLPQLLDVLTRHGVRYVLTGSVAAKLYGVEVHEPGDLDITPALDHENLRRLADVLLEIEAQLEEASAGHWETQPNGEKKWVADDLTPALREARANWSPDPTDLTTLDHLFLSRYGNFDVVPEVSGTYEALARRAVTMNAYGHDLLVEHVDDLLATLTVPRRNKDVPRVHHLRDIQRQQGGLYDR